MLVSVRHNMPSEALSGSNCRDRLDLRGDQAHQRATGGRIERLAPDTHKSLHPALKRHAAPKERTWSGMRASQRIIPADRSAINRKLEVRLILELSKLSIGHDVRPAKHPNYLLRNSEVAF